MEAFIGEIRAVSFTFAPVGWLPCDGRLLPINQNQALFALIGAMYGGDGQTNFALPDLRGRVVTGMGPGPGLTPLNLATKYGAESNKLTAAQMPQHTHTATFAGTGGGNAVPPSVTIAVASSDATVPDPNGNLLAKIPGAARGTYTSLYAPATSATANAQLGGVTFNGGTGGGITGGTVTVQPAGTPAGQQAGVSTLQPALALNYIIAVQGLFPSRP